MARRIKRVRTEHLLDFAALPRTKADGPVDWAEVYGAPYPLRVEIGVGNSDFLIRVAERAPSYNYLGFEYCMRRVLKFLKRVHAAELEQIRMLAEDARRALHELFAPDSVDHFYVNHPDPWPKRRHAKHRLVQPKNTTQMRRLLRVGGGISLRTDSGEYAAQMLEVLDATPGLVNLSGPGEFASSPFAPHSTPFEQKFLARGQPIYYLEYSRAE